MSNHCKLVPDAPNGKESILFRELNKRLNNRDAAKKIWGFTQTDLFKSEFDDLEKDENGEPTYDAIAEVLGLDAVMTTTQKDRSMAMSMGMMDSSGKAKTFSLAKTALDKADDYNSKAKQKVAVVSKTENGRYQTEIEDNTPLAIAAADRNQKRSELNTALIRLLNRCGFDVSFTSDSKYNGVFDPLNAEENANMLKEVIRVSRDEAGLESLPEEVSHLILAGLKDDVLKQRVDAAFTDSVVRRVLGDAYDRYRREYSSNDEVSVDEMLREEAEGKVLADILKGRQVTYQPAKPLLVRLWEKAKQMFRKIKTDDVDAAIINARNALQPVSDLIKSGEVQRLLDREQIMAHQKMYALSNKIEKTAYIMQEGETMLSKRLYILQNTQSEQDTQTLRKTINKVRKDLENQQYAVACYRIMNEIASDVRQLMKECDDIGFVFNNTTNLNVIASEAGLVNRMKTAVNAYIPYLETIRDLPRLVKKGEIEIYPDFADQMAKEASTMLEQLSVLQKDIRQMRFSVLKQLISLYHGDYGNKPSNFQESERAKWESVDMILSQAKEDISKWDTFLFSAGDSRNPLINVVHKIVVTQQAKRDNKINKACMKLQEAEAKLHRAGYDNKFVYRFDTEGKPTGYYVGPVDFELYEQQRKEFIESIDYENTDYYEVQRMINEWEANRLEDVEVGKPIDGKRRTEVHPKKSIYGIQDFQKGWSKEQKEYYDALMDMKAEMDSYLPVSMQCLYAAPQVRKSVSQMFDKDGRGALKTIYSKWRSEFSIVDDNPDYNKNLQYIDREGKKKILLDFEGKPIKRVPIYYLHQLEEMEDLSTDATHAMFNYIAMAVNFSEMGQLSQAMQLLQDHVNEEYEVVQNDAGKPLVDMFKALGRKYEREYVKIGKGTNVANALTEYIDRQFFNDTKEKIGNIKNPFNEDKPISVDSLYNILLKITSISRMGINILSGITNVTQGESQMICEAMAGRYFSAKDLAWSKKEYNKLLFKYMSDFNSADRHDRMYLLINQFNSSEDFFRDMRDKDFNKSAFKRVLGRGNIYFLNTMGEHYLHTSGMLNVLKHEKVKRTSDPDKEVSLYDVIKEVHDDNGWHLELDSDIEFVNKNKSFLQDFGDQQVITKEDRDKLFENLSIYIQKINADMHGGYSEAEKGNANRHTLWRAVLQFRQWMFGMYNKAYSREYYDAVTGTMREGGYQTIWKFLLGTIHDMKSMSIKLAIENNKLTEEQKQNAKVALVQSFTFVALCLIAAMTKGWKDKDDRALRLLAYQVRRLKMETGALVPYPITFIQNVFTLIQSPAAGIKTLENLSQLFDLATFFTEIQSGRFKGWWRGMRALWTATPLYNIQKLIDMDDYNYMFNIFG